MASAEQVVALIQDDLDDGRLPPKAVIDGMATLMTLADPDRYLPTDAERALAAAVDELLATSPLRRRTAQAPPWRGLRHEYR